VAVQPAGLRASALGVKASGWAAAFGKWSLETTVVVATFMLRAVADLT